jgi:hypothetical protein
MLFYLSKSPLPYRKVNYSLPGHAKNTLYEADDYIVWKLGGPGYQMKRESCRVQAFRRDTSKPLRSQFARPASEDPWYTAYNIYGKKRGEKYPDEIILFVAHKDSQSWIDSSGAYDNAVGTAACIEIGRVLRHYPAQRSIWFLFCNEEHTPWTSVTAANNAKQRGDNIIAIFNLDGLGGKSQEDIDAGRQTNSTLYTTPEGERLADLMAQVNEEYKIGLMQKKYQRKSPGDDDGSYVKAGYTSAIANIGSYPYADPNYHAPGDIPELVDLINLRMSTQASLAAALTMDLGRF